jgi:hypothetical protein
MAAKKQPANKLAETAGQINIAASKSAKPADRISSAEDGIHKNRHSSQAKPKRHFKFATLWNKLLT